MQHAPPLLIGLGNALRSDDGAGIQLAEAIAEQAPGIEVVLCHQLTPELAERISQARAVLFVDAWHTTDAAVNQPQLHPLEAANGGNPSGHDLTPRRLLALSTALYGACPPAWQLLIPGEQWQMGDQLSPRSTAACRDAMPLVLAWGARHA